MAEAKDGAVIEQPPPEPTTSPPQADVPIEQRNDVTVDELEQLSLPYPAELYNGKVVYKMANAAHGIVQGTLVTELNLFLRKKRLGVAMTETNFRLWPDRPRESRVPDIAFIRKERMPRDLNRFPEMALDLAIEIISPEDNFLQVMCKVEEYLQQGAQTVWLVIPFIREVWVCTKKGKYSVKDVLTAPELLPGFKLPLKKLFEGLPEPIQEPEREAAEEEKS